MSLLASLVKAIQEDRELLIADNSHLAQTNGAAGYLTEDAAKAAELNKSHYWQANTYLWYAD